MIPMHIVKGTSSDDFENPETFFREKPHERMIFPDFPQHKSQESRKSIGSVDQAAGTTGVHRDEQHLSGDVPPKNPRRRGSNFPSPKKGYKVEISTDPVINGVF